MILELEQSNGEIKIGGEPCEKYRRFCVFELVGSLAVVGTKTTRAAT